MMSIGVEVQVEKLKFMFCPPWDRIVAPPKLQIISGTSTQIEKIGMTCFVAFFVLYKIMYGRATSNSAFFLEIWTFKVEGGQGGHLYNNKLNLSNIELTDYQI